MRDEILLAKERITPYIKDIPLYYSHYFSEMLSADIFFKLENLQRTGSFKVRGALNAMMKNPEQCKNGVVAASAGNHAQGLAFGASLLKIPATIVMPVHTPLVKINNTKNFGANVILHGKTYDDAAIMADSLVKEKNLYLVHPFDDNDVIAGQGTLACEILRDLPDVDNIIVPVGGGGLVSGILKFVKESSSKAKVIGVQSEVTPSMVSSLKNKRIVRVTGSSSIAEGISVKVAGRKTFEVCSELLDEITTVSENEIAASILEYLEKSKLVVEGAGATPLAALLSRKVNHRNKKNVLVVSGGNIDINMITRIINKGMSNTGRFLGITLTLRDLPGSLAEVTNFLAGQEANILDIRHDRFGSGLPVGHTKVHFDLETKSMNHIEQIVIALKTASYDVQVC